VLRTHSYQEEEEEDIEKGREKEQTKVNNIKELSLQDWFNPK
jgi:hypothetical protein